MIRLGAVCVGATDDGGFNEAGRRGAERAAARHGLALALVDRIAPDAAAIEAAARALAPDCDLLLLHSGDSDGPGLRIAAEVPRLRVLVSGGDVAAPNLDSWGADQPQSAFLAGVAAGMLTRSGVVGHVSGIPIPPGLRGRDAFAAGLRHANPAARLHSRFCGDQNDPVRAEGATEAAIADGADLVFTMLNAGRRGAIAACRRHGARQIGNVADWVAAMPEVFVASAVADVGHAVERWVAAMLAHPAPPGCLRRFGLEAPEVVRLALAPDAPDAVRAAVETAAAALRDGRLSLGAPSAVP
jgi:basic membrane protein A